MIIRPATADDGPSVYLLRRGYVRDTSVTFSTDESSPQAMAADISEVLSLGHGFLVAEDDRGLAGYACYRQFRSGPGYARAMEHTILLDPRVQGQGLGRRLMSALESHAAAAGVHVLVAGVSAENAAGVAFHAACGFVETGRMREVGYKFGRWMDLVLMQKTPGH